MVNDGSTWDRAGTEAVDEEERFTGVVAMSDWRAFAIGSVYVGRQQKLTVAEACAS